MQGTMLWFNREKGFGFIRTEHDERLYVSRGGFVPEHEPSERCAGRQVTFERQAGDGEARAVNVAFASTTDPRRARLRRARGGSML